MNNLIRVSFRNDKALASQKVVSQREFPIKTVFCDDKHTYALVDLKNPEEFDKYIKALAAYIIGRYESKILKRIIKKNYPEIPHFAVNEIVKSRDDVDHRERTEVVENILKGYFRENKSGNVEGIVNFRFYEYEKLLNAISEDLVDIYYLNREYEDFIELLRYFISVQDRRPEMIYLIVNKYGMYTILNEKRQDITNRCLAEFLSPEDVRRDGYDDLLISILITLAPEKIMVENKENIKNEQLFETIEKVFGKVVYKQEQ